MLEATPNMNQMMIQMILAVVEGRISEIRAEIKRELLIENKPFLTVSDVALLTGLQKTSVYRLCADSKIGYYRPSGKQTYFTMEDVRQYILNERHYSKSKSEIRRNVLNEFTGKNI